MTGPNGSGKSTLLEVARLLGAFAGEGLDPVLEVSRARQIPELLFRGEGTSFQVAVEIPIPDAVLAHLDRADGSQKRVVRYEVEIGARDASQINEPRILAENLWLLDARSEVARNETAQQELSFPSTSLPARNLIHGQNKSPAGWRKVASKQRHTYAYFKSETSDWNFTLKNGAGRSALSSLPEDDRFGIANWAKTQLTVAVKKLALRSELMQAPCPPLKEKGFSPDGSTLPLVVRELRRDEGSFRGWVAHLRTVLPVTDVDVIEREEDKNTYLSVSFEGGLKVPSWHLSDGTLRLMALTLLAYIKTEGSLFLVEEPENGLHPQAIEPVFQSLSSIYDGQALVATHSPVLVGLIKPDQLLCFSKTTAGETDIVRGDLHPKLRQWQGDLRIAQLFAAGILS